MQNYKTIIGVVELRLQGVGYSATQKRYGVGSSTVTLIMKRFKELSCSIEELKAMAPKDVEETFYADRSALQSIPCCKNSDVFALLSDYEGLPNTIYEALILGTPVISTIVGGTPYQIQEGETGWLVENNEDAIYQGLKHIFDHPEEVQRIKDNLKEYRYDNATVLRTAKEVLFSGEVDS